MNISQLDQFIRTIKAIVAANYAAGTPNLIGEQVRAAAKASGIDAAQAVKQQRAVENALENEFVSSKTLKSNQADSEISNYLSQQAQGVANNVTSSVAEIVRRQLRTGEDIQGELKRILGEAQRYSRTIEETVKAALVTEKHNRLAAQFDPDGDPLMKYLGPIGSNSRPYCRKNVGKVQRLSQWRAEVNDFSQSVAVFLGGWRCRHRLVVVVE